jgi:nucleoside-diphosphate-sugar epimerase
VKADIAPLRVAVTGAGGFVGAALVRRLCNDPSFVCTAVYRVAPAHLPPGSVKLAVVGDFADATDLGAAFADTDVVVHAAARVHIMNETGEASLAAFRRVNVDATVKVATEAARQGVRRFVFLSSIKVNGESTLAGRPFRSDDVPAPADPYAVSKHEAEQALSRLCKDMGMEFVVIRPPLVYGPGVKANFASLMTWVDRGVPLPLAGIHNRRTLVALPNLVDLILCCLTAPGAAGQTLLAGDGEDVSTTDLVTRMARALGKSPRLFAIPMPLARFAASLLGKGPALQRLHGNLQLDIGRTRELAGWTPMACMDDVLREMADAMRGKR